MESSSSAPTQPPLLGSWAESTPMAQLDAQQLPYLDLALVVVLASCARAQGSKEDRIPCLNPSRRPLIFGKDPAASKSFTANARGILAEGRKRFPGQPFRITSDSGETTILPPSLIHDIRNEPGLSFIKAISETFHTHLPGFEPFATGNRADSLIQVVVRKQLTKLLSQSVCGTCLQLYNH